MIGHDEFLDVYKRGEKQMSNAKTCLPVPHSGDEEDQPAKRMKGGGGTATTVPPAISPRPVTTTNAAAATTTAGGGGGGETAGTDGGSGTTNMDLGLGLAGIAGMANPLSLIKRMVNRGGGGAPGTTTTLTREQVMALGWGMMLGASLVGSSWPNSETGMTGSDDGGSRHENDNSDGGHASGTAMQSG